MNANQTSEFSFVIKPSQHGVGVFAVHDIAKGTHLRLFGDKDQVQSVTRLKEEVPEIFRDYCVDRGNELICPEDFGHMHIGWYLNHSHNPNAIPDENYEYYTLRDIKAGEEVTIDYNLLGEPEAAKKEYYKD